MALGLAARCAALMHGRALFWLASFSSPRLCRTSIILPTIHLQSLPFNET